MLQHSQPTSTGFRLTNSIHCLSALQRPLFERERCTPDPWLYEWWSTDYGQWRSKAIEQAVALLCFSLARVFDRWSTWKNSYNENMLASAAIRNLARPTRAFQPTRSYASEKPNKPYVLVNKHTKVICQGITGKQVHHFFRLQTRSNVAISSVLFIIIGNFPHHSSYWVWHEDGWWRLSWQGRVFIFCSKKALLQFLWTFLHQMCSPYVRFF